MSQAALLASSCPLCLPDLRVQGQVKQLKPHGHPGPFSSLTATDKLVILHVWQVGATFPSLLLRGRHS